MTPLRFNAATGELQISGRLLGAIGAIKRFGQQAFRNGRRSLCLDPEMSWLWPRWFLFRALGVLGIFAFLSWAGDIDGFYGPHGLYPAGGDLTRNPGFLGLIEALYRTPTLFWFSTGAWLPKVLVGAGLAASISLIFNVLPKASLIISWLCYLSLCTPSPVLSGIQIDPLQLELLFIAIFVAPSGFRPGLAAAQAPNRFGILLLRLTTLKVMLGSGLCKFTTGDAYWWSFTAMDHMYETAPFPALLGYYSHLLPHWFHIGETLMMMAAELAAPLALLFCGRRAKLAGLAVWTAFHLGIEANCNFGWLNIAAIGSAVALLDDEFLISVIPALAARRPARAEPARAPGVLGRILATCALSLSLLASLVSAPGNMLPDDAKIPAFVQRLNRSLAPLLIGNPLGLYRHILVDRHVVVAEGSDDGGKTWREYHYRYLPQDVSSMSPYHAPLMARFDNAMHVVGLFPQMMAPLIIHQLARRLVEGRPEVTAMFRENPFPEHPPQLIRFAVYAYRLTTAAEHGESGHYWVRRLNNIWPPH